MAAPFSHPRALAAMHNRGYDPPTAESLPTILEKSTSEQTDESLQMGGATANALDEPDGTPFQRYSLAAGEPHREPGVPVNRFLVRQRATDADNQTEQFSGEDDTASLEADDHSLKPPSGLRWVYSCSV